MHLPKNQFKQRLIQGVDQLGLWCSLPGSYATEAVAGSGYDWLLFDTEHSPGDVLTVLPQLQTVAGYDVSAIIRPAANDAVLIKRFLDIGAQTLLIPFVQSAADAERAVAAMRYPPRGIRGVSSLTRATRFGRTKDYAKRAESELCLLVQIETVPALEELDHAVVADVIEQAIQRIRACGKPAGILATDPDMAKRYMQLGVSFAAVAIDVGILARGTEAALRQLRSH